MKDLNIQKEINQIKKISLTKNEKSKILHNISVYADFHTPIPSPFSIFSFVNINKKLVYALASILIFVLTGGSLAYASENSLPGDMLYSIKTEVVEPIRISMAKTPEEKAVLETDFANRRLKEAEDLNRLGKLTPKFKKELDDKFNNHFSKYNELKKELEKDISTSSKEKTAKIQKGFDDKIKNYADVLDKFDRDIKGIKKVYKGEIDNLKLEKQNIKKEIINLKDQNRNPEKQSRENASSGKRTEIDL